MVRDHPSIQTLAQQATVCGMTKIVPSINVLELIPVWCLR